MKVERDEAYILHRRSFKESSVVIECFSRHHGWLSLVARGAKRARSRFDALLQPFMPLQLEWAGKGELKTLYKAETKVFHPVLKQEKLLIGFYINELMVRLLQRLDPHPALFDSYDQLMSQLSDQHGALAIQSLLRHFEVTLLAELGYGLELEHDALTGQPIQAELLYGYDPKQGIYEVSGSVDVSKTISGAALIALKNNDYSDETLLLETKKWMRFVLSHYLGDKPLATRQLFVPV